MKILALDGGGVFGRIQSRILDEANCSDKFDVFVGTSIGAPQVLALALGKSELVRPSFFDENMPKIFKKNLLRRLNLFRSEYSDVGLNNALQKAFGSSILGDCKKPCFITAADIGQKTLKVFSSMNFEDRERFCWEVCRQATAAETYFPSWKGYADGGIYANNPSMVGIAAASRVLKAKIEDIEILSIGTGDFSGNGEVPENRVSTALWVVKAMLEGSADKMHDYFVRSLPVKKYERINFVLNPKWKMDDPDSMYYSERAWALDIVNAVKKVREF